MSNEVHATVLRHVDSDGDEIEVAWDPLAGDPEDVWIEVVQRGISGCEIRRAVVRVPLEVLAEAVAKMRILAGGGVLAAEVGFVDDVLRKYIRLVADCEGVTFISPDRGKADSTWTDEQWAYLVAAEEEAFGG